MLVVNRMSHPVITVREDLPIQEALSMMHREHVRRFPVVDDRGKLIGIVSETDLLNASPSDATSLNVWEINYLLSKITVGKVMSRNVITVQEDTPLEEAARIMADHKIGGLPVMRGEELVGIITETNLFRIFLELLGAREQGVRMSVILKNEPGQLVAVTEAVQKLGGNIVALGTFTGEIATEGIVVIKVQGVSHEALRQAIQPLVVRIDDMRDCCG